MKPIELSLDCGDAATMSIALTFLYLGFIEQQQQVATTHLMSLVALADYLGIQSLMCACKALIAEYLRQLKPERSTQVPNCNCVC